MEMPPESGAQRFRSRWALGVTTLAPVLPQLLGSTFNIWYNVSVIDPLLATMALKQRFLETVIIYNVIAYPITVAIWLGLVYSLRPVLRQLVAGTDLDEAELAAARRRVIRLPLWVALISAMAWLLCIPVFLISLANLDGALDGRLFWHLPISFLVSGFISITHGFFVVELATHWGLFPLLFHNTRADLTPGVIALSLRGRGVLWAISAGICPIGSLLLLSFAPPAPGSDPQWFAVFVGTVGIAFGLCTSVMLSRLVARPLDELRAAAQSVARGDFDVRVPLVRADEFGLLIGEFNHMIGELKGKERLRQTFGLHVGRQAAEQILANDPGLSGVEKIITVMFVDIRSFTARSAEISASETVKGLNEFLRVMVEVVEDRHGGMINKFLGDGFMALFGIGGGFHSHAGDALAAGREMLQALEALNARIAKEGRQAVAVGIGIHTGPAVIGSIGSPQRLEFTAIGSTVNLASRIEALTKSLGTPLLVTEATRSALGGKTELKEFPPQPVRGMSEPMKVFGV